MATTVTALSWTKIFMTTVLVILTLIIGYDNDVTIVVMTFLMVMVAPLEESSAHRGS